MKIYQMMHFPLKGAGTGIYVDTLAMSLIKRGHEVRVLCSDHYIPNKEYKSLRQEIMSRQNARRLILGFTITAIGSIIGFVLQGEIALEYDLDYYAFSLIIFAIVIIIAALILTIHHTQQIDVIGAYIRKFIEPKMPGLNWQTYWFRYRELRRYSPKAEILLLSP